MRERTEGVVRIFSPTWGRNALVAGTGAYARPKRSVYPERVRNAEPVFVRVGKRKLSRLNKELEG
jgi:hypothetical protein